MPFSVIASVILILAGLLPSPVQAAESYPEIDTIHSVDQKSPPRGMDQQKRAKPLIGLKDVDTTVSVFDGSPAYGASRSVEDKETKEAIKHELLSALKKIGVGTEGKDGSKIAVDCTYSRGGNDLIFYCSLELALWQKVQLARDPKNAMSLITWRRVQKIDSGKKSDITAAIGKLMDEFVLDWLAANPARR